MVGMQNIPTTMFASVTRFRLVFRRTVVISSWELQARDRAERDEKCIGDRAQKAHRQVKKSIPAPMIVLRRGTKS